MDTKLTLKLDKRVIERAKRFSKKRNTSLSKMIEIHLNSITNGDEIDIEITPFVESLSGVISLTGEINHKEDYNKYIDKKYK